MLKNMKNVQISFDEITLEGIDRVAAASRKTRSAIIRTAVKAWLEQKEIQEFEDKWIAQLVKNPNESEDSEAWLQADRWEDQ